MTTRTDAADVLVGRVRCALPWGLALSMVLSAALDAQQPLPTTVRAWHGSWFDTEVTREKPVAIDVHYTVTAVRRADGQVFVRGANGKEWCFVPPLPPGVRYVDVSLGELCVALRSDGQIVQWGLQAAATRRPLPVPGNPWVAVEAGGAFGLPARAAGAAGAAGADAAGR